MPGKPFSTSTSTPESSPTAGSPSASRAASALIWAFTAYVVPTSATPGSTPIRVSPVPARSSRYSPSLPALPVAMASRRSAKGGDGSFLRDDQLLDSLAGQPEHRVQLRPVVRLTFRRRLELDQAPILDHDAVEVCRGVEVLRVVEVQHRRALDDAAADGRQVLAHRDLADHPRIPHALDRHVQRTESAGDGGRARAAVGLQNVTIEGDSPLADLAHVDRGTQRAPDQTLNLVRPAAKATLDRFAHATVVGRTRKHRVLGGDPSLSASAPMGGHAILHARRDPHPRAAHLDQA